MEEAIRSREEVARRGQELYDQSIRTQVEIPENIGKMVVIDVETGEYGVGDNGLITARRLHANRPGTALFGIRIGYRTADAIGGVMERTAL